MVYSFGWVYIFICLLFTGFVIYKEHNTIIARLKDKATRKWFFIEYVVFYTLCIPFIPIILAFLYLASEYDD